MLGSLAGDLPMSVTRVNTPEGERDYIFCLRAEWLPAGKLPPEEAVIGMLKQPFNPEKPNFAPGMVAPNPVFVDFLQWVIAQRGPELASIVTEGRRADRRLYVFDRRTRTPDKEIPRRDVFGAFELKDGKIVPGSYQRNKDYLLISEDGYPHLPSELAARLVQELRALAQSAG